MSRERSPSGPKDSTGADPRPGGGSVADAVERFQAGIDREASFQVLYRRFQPQIERFFARKGFPAPECLDLAQETFLEVYTGLGSYRREGRFEAWLFTIATSTYRKRLRAAAAEKRSALEVSQDDEAVSAPTLAAPPEQLDALLDHERRTALRTLVEQMPEQMRKCLTLRLYQELSYREIAVILKIKIDTVKVHLFRGRERLRQELQDEALRTLDL